MAIKKFVVGNFYDEQVLFAAIRGVRKTGYKIHDVYTPFPIHGLDTAIGLRDTSLHTAGFVYGITGTATAFSFITWVFTTDYPMNIGGKPLLALPAWIPIIFELTVLFAAVGMVLTFCYLCQMAPFVKKDHFNPRSTDDTFTMVIECNTRTNEQEVSSFLESLGAAGVSVQNKETGWWMGFYDRPQKLYNHVETETVA